MNFITLFRCYFQDSNINVFIIEKQKFNKQIDLKVWMSRFHGVATKYLQSYLMWFVIMNKYLKELIDQDIGRLLNLSSHDRWTWDKYREIISQRYD